MSNSLKTAFQNLSASLGHCQENSRSIIEALKRGLNDLANNSEDAGSSQNYSTTEQIIGKWIDGKPIYQKTFTDLRLVSINGTVFNHGIENFGECIRIFGRCKYNNTGIMLPLPYASNNIIYTIYIGNVTATTFDIGCGNGFNSIQELSATIQYTKTTD